MELGVAAGVAAMWAAYKASVDEGHNPAVGDVIRSSLRRLIQLTREDAADVLRGSPVKLSMERERLEGEAPLAPQQVLAVATYLRTGDGQKLRSLDLSRSSLADAAVAAQLAEAIGGVGSLEVLRLRACALAGAAADALCLALRAERRDGSAGRRLAELELANNALDADGGRALARALPALPALRTLDLSYNALGTAGVAALADALASHGTLTSLGLASNQLETDALRSLAGALRTSVAPLAELDVEHNSIGDEALAELLRAVAARGALRQLRLGSNAFTADAANTLAAHLVAFPAGPLRSVGLANNAVGGGGDALVAALRANTSLTELSLVGTGLTAAHAEALASCAERNRLAQAEEARARRAALVQQAKERRAAPGGGAAPGSSSSSPSAAATPPPPAEPTELLASSFPHSLSSPREMPTPGEPARGPLPGSMPAADGSVAATPAATTGLSLPLGRCGVGGGAAEPPSGALGSSPGSSTLGGSPVTLLGSARTPAPRAVEGRLLDDGTPVVRQLRQIRLLPNARAVLLAGAALHDEHMSEIADYVRDNPATATLALAGNELTDDGACALAEALGASSVTELDLASNVIEDRGALALAAAIGKGFAPRKLSLADNLVSDAGAAALIRAAAALPALSSLDLSLNQAGAAAAETAREHGGARGQQLVIDLRGNDDATDAAAAAARALDAKDSGTVLLSGETPRTEASPGVV